MTAGDAYYWAGGRKVPLSASGEVAVDLTGAAEGGVADADLAPLRSGGRELTRGLVLLDPQTIAAPVRETLEALCVVHPVYRADDATIVVLPEVRVEIADPASLQQLEDRVETGDLGARVTDRLPGRLVLVPQSGRGADALDLANRLVEEMAPDVAQARFLRVVPRP